MKVKGRCVKVMGWCLKLTEWCVEIIRMFEKEMGGRVKVTG